MQNLLDPHKHRLCEKKSVRRKRRRMLWWSFDSCQTRCASLFYCGWWRSTGWRVAVPPPTNTTHHEGKKHEHKWKKGGRETDEANEWKRMIFKQQQQGKRPHAQRNVCVCVTRSVWLTSIFFPSPSQHIDKLLVCGGSSAAGWMERKTAMTPPGIADKNKGKETTPPPTTWENHHRGLLLEGSATHFNCDQY